jgi:hypothetical protein
MVYHSQAWQDEFVANLLNFKREGYYLDIGSFHAIPQNNTYFFESELDWKGVCVEMNPYFIDDYKQRICHFVNNDATKVDYKIVLDELKYPSKMDYLSIDIDENSAAGLRVLPLDDYKFSVITIEHDSYRFGDAIKNEERSILYKHDYTLLFQDVLVPLGCGMGPNLSFEDWWVYPTSFNMDKLSKLSALKMYPDDIVAMLKSKHEMYTI